MRDTAGDVVPGRRYRVAIIGTGRPRGQPGASGAAMARLHLLGCLAGGRCDVVALADIRRRARVDLPLAIDDSPFLTMLERREIGPRRIVG